MDYDTLVVNGLIVTEQGQLLGSIGIEGGVIRTVSDRPISTASARQVIDARGLVVLPGVIEPHCHFWDPGPTHREDWATGTMSAAAGGITTVIEMPLSVPPTVDVDSYQIKLDRAQKLAFVDFALWGGVIPQTVDRLDEHVSALDRLGVVGYKAFMCRSANEYPPLHDGELAAAMAVLAERGDLLAVHAENDAFIQFMEARLQGQDRREPQAFLDSRPPIAELEAIHRALLLAEAFHTPLYIVHMTLAEGAREISRRKKAGQRVFVETAPQYLTCQEQLVRERGPFGKCAPPLRRQENVEALWDYVLDGTIDTIGSDHAPFTLAEKEAGLEDIWLAPNGLPGIQTMLPALLTEGIHRRGLSLVRLSQLCASNVAKIFGLYPQKGTIRPGSDADLTLVDLDERWTLSPEMLYYKNPWSPYIGYEFQGRVRRTLLRGESVYAEGEVVGRQGMGRYLARPEGVRAPIA